MDRLRDALIELDKILDFGAPAERCDCFPHPEGLNAAMENARAALAAAQAAGVRDYLCVDCGEPLHDRCVNCRRAFERG